MVEHDENELAEGSASSEVTRVLTDNHRQFLSFLMARLGSRAIAEELLQAAFVKGLEKADSIRNEDRATAWFYRLLRNALMDYYRRQITENRVLEHQSTDVANFDQEIIDTVCKCVNALIPTLKPEYSNILQAADVQELPLETVAKELRITPNNAAVRLHRARQALKRQLERSCGTCVTHGCLDCTCDH